MQIKSIRTVHQSVTTYIEILHASFFSCTCSLELLDFGIDVMDLGADVLNALHLKLLLFFGFRVSAQQAEQLDIIVECHI